MSGEDANPETGDANRIQATPLPVHLGDLLGTIREAVQTEVNFAVARLAAQQQPGPSLPPLPVPDLSPASSGKPMCN